MVRLSIRDEGPGIPPEIQSRVFEPFFTTRPAGEGVGLGLPICEQIVKHHQGHIWFESDSERGTTFYVDLPAAHMSAVEHRGHGAAPVQEKRPPPARILVVDDEKSITNLLAKVLTRTGHHVDTALDGLEALDKLQQNVYDIAFLDLKIPALSGKAVYIWIKQNQPRLAERTVILTGDTLSSDTLDFLEHETAAHLLKPFQLVQLRNVLGRIWP